MTAGTMRTDEDPVFGPLVAFGPGGTSAEPIGDANLRLAPLADVDARELVGGPARPRLPQRPPRLAFPDGWVAVDARVRVRRPELERRAKSW